METQPTVHATAIRWRGYGLLIRGASGTGKSRLALALLIGEGILPQTEKTHATHNLATCLVADDRVVLERSGEKLLASPAAGLEGLIEARGHGLLNMPWAETTAIHLVIDLVPSNDVPRMPTQEEVMTDLEGCALPRVAVPVGDLAHQVLMVQLAVHKSGSSRQAN